MIPGASANAFVSVKRWCSTPRRSRRAFRSRGRGRSPIAPWRQTEWLPGTRGGRARRARRRDPSGRLRSDQKAGAASVRRCSEACRGVARRRRRSPPIRQARTSQPVGTAAWIDGGSVSSTCQLRNRLINFKENKQSIRFGPLDLPKLEDVLAAGRELRVMPRAPIMSGFDPRDAALHESRTGEDPIRAAVREE